MKKRSKLYKQREKYINEQEITSLPKAIEVLKNASQKYPLKFDETVELHIRLGIDTRKSDQQVRSSILLPHGTGKIPKILVFAKGEKLKEAEDAGADYFGADELINKISSGWLDFDVAIATPDVMAAIGKLGKILGPRGLMPNPKTGTVTMDIKTAVKQFKLGKVEFKADSQGIVHIPIGKISFESEKIKENLLAVYKGVLAVKPSSSKGQYIKSVYISSTMGKSIKIENSWLN